MSLVGEESSAFAVDKSCLNCGAYFPLANRSSFLQRRSDSVWECDKCLEEKRRVTAQKAKLEEEAKKELIWKYWEPNNQQLRSPEDFSLRDVVLFLSLVRGGADESYQYIQPVQSFQEAITPDKEFTMSVLKYLYERYRFTPHPGSPVMAFDFKEDRSSFSPYEVFWVRPQWDDLREANNFFESIIKDDQLPAEWEKDVPSLWREFSLQEGLELLKHYTTEHNLYIKIGKKTRDVLTNVLEDYSLGQLQNFLWRATKDAAAYYMRENISKSQAANSVITRLQGSYEKSKANNWEIKPYGRLFNLPQSIVSQVFFNAVMKSPDTYRQSIPPI